MAIGSNAGIYTQGAAAVAIGYQSGQFTQGNSAVAIGSGAGQYYQGSGAVAIGVNAAGNFTQGVNAIAIGSASGVTNQGSGAVAIGLAAGFSTQGVNAIAIGVNAGRTSQPANSIVINASGVALNGAVASASYISPLRSGGTFTSSGTAALMLYNPTTFEIGYSTGNTTLAKTFVIDHPKDPEKYLVHACMEGPEAGVYYRGKGFIQNESVIIELPEYTLEWSDFTVHLTPIGGFAELWASEVLDGKYTVYSNKPVKFNWVVYAQRSAIETEPLKNSVNVKGTGPYRWI